MPSQLGKSGLRLVPAKRSDVSHFRLAGVQQSLFDDSDPWLVVFASVPDLPDDTLADLIRCSAPSAIFDLRLAPRFDIGVLNRERAFELFDSVDAVYFDATTPLMNGATREDALGRLLGRIETKSAQERRPVLFLFGRTESSLASEMEVLSLLESIERPTKIISIPSES